MKTYRVFWSIDVTAANARAAAKEALAIQRDPESIAIVFEVTDERNRSHVIDLLPGGASDR